MQDRLPDLSDVIQQCKDKIDALGKYDEVTISSENAAKFIASYRDQNPKDKITFVGKHTFTIETEKHTRNISIQEFPVLAILSENLAALEIYRSVLDEVARDMGFSGRGSQDGKKFFAHMPNTDWRTNISPLDPTVFDNSANAILRTQNDIERINKFVSDPDWSGMADEDGNVGRKLDRPSDWQESAILKTAGLVAAASAGRVKVIRAITDTGLGSPIVSIGSAAKPPPLAATTKRLSGGENVIYYGAPGTGKSYAVDQVVKSCKHVRTVFHPDLQNSDFFGTLKPEMKGKKLQYGFMPGPFMKAVSEAVNNPGEMVYLVIEELNRAAAAAVFGDLFLLLDRDANGESEYDVAFPSKDSELWLANKTGIDFDKLKLPSNLSIYATMNSADHGVFPLDTAFRRRWRQEYMTLNYSKGPVADVGFILEDGSLASIPWKDFVQKLNDHLLSQDDLAISEDRLLGQWFAKATEMDPKGVPNKVLLYLWDDLLRHGGRDRVFAESRIKTYGQLSDASEKGQAIFASDFLLALTT